MDSLLRTDPLTAEYIFLKSGHQMLLETRINLRTLRKGEHGREFRDYSTHYAILRTLGATFRTGSEGARYDYWKVKKTLDR